MTHRAPHVTVTTTTDAEGLAAGLAREMVRRRLAACAQVDTITSHYWWDGAVQESAEYRIVFKTRAGRTDELVEAILAAHTYDVPEVVVSPIVSGAPAYLEWVTTETTDRAPERHPG